MNVYNFVAQIWNYFYGVHPHHKPVPIFVYKYELTTNCFLGNMVKTDSCINDNIVIRKNGTGVRFNIDKLEEFKERLCERQPIEGKEGKDFFEGIGNLRW